MSFHFREESLRKIAHVPVVCIQCSYSNNLVEHDEPLNRALVDSTYLYELRQELGLLERTEQFFARFPESKHRLKVSKTYQDREELRGIQDDPEFEGALRAEPELYGFLNDRHSSFKLQPRLRGVRECIQQLQQDLDFALVKCPKCETGRLVIEDKFFQRL